MASRSFSSHLDPAEDAAALLRRIGFATLMMAMPVAALVARRAVVVLVPIGVALLVIAAFLDHENPPLIKSLRRIVLSKIGLTAGILLGWCALSLSWTPFAASASERLFNIVTTIFIAGAGYCAMPRHMRSANLYLLVVGIGLSAFTATLLGLFDAHNYQNITSPGVDAEGRSLARGLIVLVILVWPALSWLLSRERKLEAYALGAAVFLSTLLGPYYTPAISIFVGLLVFALISWRPFEGLKVTWIILASLILSAPLLPFILKPVVGLIWGSSHPLIASLDVWQNIILSEPLRLLTGHGFDTALRARIHGLIPSYAPTNVLFEIWYELGLVGALVASGSIWAGARAIARLNQGLMAGAMAAFVTIFILALFGVGTSQMWWLTTLIVLALVFVAAQRTQTRGERPKALSPVNPF